MQNKEKISDAEIEIVLEKYDAISRPYQICQLSKKGVWVVNNQFVVKHIRKTNFTNNICLIFDSLNAMGIHIGNYIRTSNGQAFSQGKTSVFMVTKYIEGKQFDIENALREKAVLGKTIGNSLAKLHFSFNLIKKGSFEKANTMNEYDEAIRYLHSNNIIIPSHIINECESLKTIYNYLPRQIIHRDIHLNNLIIDSNYNIFFLDFDNCENNVRIYDIAYFGVTLLEAVDNKTKLSRWWILYGSFLQGYFHENELSQNELDSIWKMFLVLQICFIKYYFEIDNNVYNANMRLNKLIYMYNHRNDIIKLIRINKV